MNEEPSLPLPSLGLSVRPAFQVLWPRLAKRRHPHLWPRAGVQRSRLSRAPRSRDRACMRFSCALAWRPQWVTCVGVRGAQQQPPEAPGPPKPQVSHRGSEFRGVRRARCSEPAARACAQPGDRHSLARPTFPRAGRRPRPRRWGGARGSAPRSAPLRGEASPAGPPCAPQTSTRRPGAQQPQAVPSCWPERSMGQCSLRLAPSLFLTDF